MAHTIEVSKSGRATCRSCRKPIAKGELRFGEEIPNQFSGDGETSYRYHHLTCVASKLPNELRAAIAAYDGDIPGKDDLEKIMAEAALKVPPPFPYADRAPTGRAKCIACSEPIAKDTLRVVVERDIERGMTVTKGAGYLHPACAAAYVEGQGGNHAELTEGLRENTRSLSDAELDELFNIT